MSNDTLRPVAIFTRTVVAGLVLVTVAGGGRVTHPAADLLQNAEAHQRTITATKALCDELLPGPKR
jgi:hypothetical protein